MKIKTKAIFTLSGAKDWYPWYLQNAIVLVFIFTCCSIVQSAQANLSDSSQLAIRNEEVISNSPVPDPETKKRLSSYKYQYLDRSHKDEPFWNWFVHPISGSQIYLFYRADGYSRIEAFNMTFITSALFEFTIEIFTEPASVQDLYQTPVLGSILGLGIENFSMYLLNTGNPLASFFGHLMNPMTMLPLFKGKTLIIPTTDIKNPDNVGAMLYTRLEF
ncbi:MAG: DUF3943 domain-containing protein [Bacteriovoracaceae bacterium]|nr:DUF3943 domain-containing protein [Bacteriovoracaceae bacterium]